MDCSTPGSLVLHCLPEFAQIHVHWVSDAIYPVILCRSLSFAFNLPQNQGLFQWVRFLHQVAKYWSFSISPSNEYSELIPFRIDWFDLLALLIKNNIFFFFCGNVQQIFPHPPTFKAGCLNHFLKFSIEPTIAVNKIDIWVTKDESIY